MNVDTSIFSRSSRSRSKQRESTKPEIKCMMRDGYKLHKDDHWMRRDLVRVGDHSVFGKSIIANIDMPLSESSSACIAEDNIQKCRPIGCIEMAQLIDVSFAKSASHADARYIITIDDAIAYDLADSWTGLINHARRDKANLTVIGTRIYQIKDIQEGDHLTYDYGIDYWVFQLTHLEKSNWNRSDRRLWRQLHCIINDWTPLMTMGLHLKVPFDIIRYVAHYFNSINASNARQSEAIAKLRTNK